MPTKDEINYDAGRSYTRRWKFIFTRHKWWTIAARVCTLFTILLISLTIGYCLFGEELGIHSQFLKLVVLFVLGKIVGVIISYVHIPPMLGMLAVGVLLRNTHYIELSGPYLDFATILRQLALVNILLPAGLGLNPAALRKMSWLVVFLSLVPPALEIIVIMLMSVWLMNLPWLWSLLLGFLLSAVGPAVVIPCLFELQERGYGTDKGIHTLVIAGATLNDITCIAGCGIIIDMIFDTGSLMMQLLKGPIVLGMGTSYGVALGVMAWYLPDRRDTYVVTLRTIFIGVGSVLASVGSVAVGFAGAGALGCIVGAFVACCGWRKQGWSTEYNPVKENFSILWKFFEPISFGLIGIEVDLYLLEEYLPEILWGTICMSIALLVRCFCSVLITYKSYLNWKETVFVAISWIPKATVQAALGPVALDYARKFYSEELKEHAMTILVVAVVSIIITMPIGALLIMHLGPRFLSNDLPEDNSN